jgi:hypothetical protein
MHCLRCKSITAETAQQAADRSQVTWYQCPVCGTQQLHSQPTFPAMNLHVTFAAGPGPRRLHAGR